MKLCEALKAFIEPACQYFRNVQRVCSEIQIFHLESSLSNESVQETRG